MSPLCMIRPLPVFGIQHLPTRPTRDVSTYTSWMTPLRQFLKGHFIPSVLVIQEFHCHVLVLVILPLGPTFFPDLNVGMKEEKIPGSGSRREGGTHRQSSVRQSGGNPQSLFLGTSVVPDPQVLLVP